MLRSRILTYALLIAATTIIWSCRTEGLRAAASKRYPADQPAQESEDQAQSSYSELTPGDDFETFAAVVRVLGWESPAWATHDLEPKITLRICLGDFGRCRAPPASRL